MEGVEQGLGAQAVSDSIKGFFDAQAGWRAERVARSEVITGYGAGSLEGYRQSGVVTQKRWITAADEKVDGGDYSGPCNENEKKGAIPLDDEFPSGHQHPTAHPNCRCTLAPVV